MSAEPVRLHPADVEAIAALVAAAVAPAPERLLNAEQAAELLGVPASWVLAEARAERIPYVPVGRYRRFDRDELVKWWRARARGPRR